MTAAEPNMPQCDCVCCIHEHVECYEDFVMSLISFEEDRYRTLDQLGSLIGTSCGECSRVGEYSYDPFGAPLHRPIAFDGHKSRIAGVSYDSLTQRTSISLNDAYLMQNCLPGLEVHVSGGAPGAPVISRSVYSNSTSGLVVDDPGGVIANAIAPGGVVTRGFTVFGFHDGREATGGWEMIEYEIFQQVSTLTDLEACFLSDNPRIGDRIQPGDALYFGPGDGPFIIETVVDEHKIIVDGDLRPFINDAYQIIPGTTRSGAWTSNGTYNYGLKTTTFPLAPLPVLGLPCVMGPQIGQLCEVDIAKGVTFPIVATGANTVTVAGDARGIAQAGSRFRIYAPPGTDPLRGSVPQGGPDEISSRLLYAGYRYLQPPGNRQFGNSTSAGQPGANHTGNYLCFNRVYDPGMGRWTTPDPAASPWENLNEYATTAPIAIKDAIGLACENINKQLAEWLIHPHGGAVSDFRIPSTSVCDSLCNWYKSAQLNPKAVTPDVKDCKDAVIAVMDRIGCGVRCTERESHKFQGEQNNDDAVACIFTRSNNNKLCCSNKKSTICCTDVVTGDKDANPTEDPLKDSGPTPFGQYLIGCSYTNRRKIPAKELWHNIYRLKEDSILPGRGTYAGYRETYKGRHSMALHSGTRSLGCVTNRSEDCHKKLSALIDTGRGHLSVDDKSLPTGAHRNVMNETGICAKLKVQ